MPRQCDSSGRCGCRYGLRDAATNLAEAALVLWLLRYAAATLPGVRSISGLGGVLLGAAISVALWRVASGFVIRRLPGASGPACWTLRDWVVRRLPRAATSGPGLPTVRRPVSTSPVRSGRGIAWPWSSDPEWDAIERVPRMPYEAYIRSPMWFQRRRLMIAAAGGRCQQCGTTERLEVHHRTYDRLGHERRSDLLVVCHACHQRIHGITPRLFGWLGPRIRWGRRSTPSRSKRWS